MRAKTIVTGILLLFVAVSVLYLVVNGNRKPGGEAQTPADLSKREVSSRESGGTRTPDEKIEGLEVIAYYFHGNRRCTTCRTIEAYAEEAIRSNFPAELASRRLRWQVVNVDEPENAHFVQDYQLVTRSLVLVEVEKDVQKKWKNLDKVWQLVRSKPEFTDYVVETTREFMAGTDG